MHGQSWEGAKQRVPQKCQAKGSGLRDRNNQVLGKATGTEIPGQSKWFVMTGGTQSLGVSQGTGLPMQRIFMGLFRVLSWFYINAIEPNP